MYVHYMVGILSTNASKCIYKTIPHGNKVDKSVETTDLNEQLRYSYYPDRTSADEVVRSHFVVLSK